MGGSVHRENSSTPKILWDAYPSPTGGCHEDVDPAEPGEGSWIHLTSSTTMTPAQERLASPSGLPIVPADPEDNTYGQAAHFLPQFPGQGFSHYQDTMEGEAAVVWASDRITRAPPPHPYPSRDNPYIPADLQYSPPAAMPIYGSPELVYPSYRHVVQLPPAPRANNAASECERSDLIVPTPPMNRTSTADGFHTEDQFSSATLDDGYGSYDWRAPMILYSSGTYYRRPAAMEHRPLFNNTLPAATISRMADDLGYRDHSGPLPSGGVGNEGKTQLPVGPLPVGSENVGCQRPNKRKRAMTLDERRERRRARPRRSQCLDLEDLTQPTIPTIPSPPPGFHMVEQVPYRCKTQQKGWERHPSIEFRVQGTKGMELTDALNLRFNGPDGRDDLMFTHDSIGNSVSCRIAFKGYLECDQKQIVTTNHKKTRGRITREKLAQVIARRIESYLEELEEDRTPFPIRFEDMLLAGLHNTARASWQPEIWYRVSPSTSS